MMKTLHGTSVRRYKDRVGKAVGFRVYVHRDYADEIVPRSILADSEAVAERELGFPYNCVMYDRKTGIVRFDEAPDFDSAREPHVGRYLVVRPDGTSALGKSDSIWHHKWLWVRDDYEGFDVQASKRWSEKWLAKVGEVANGSEPLWKRQLQRFGVEESMDGSMTVGEWLHEVESAWWKAILEQLGGKRFLLMTGAKNLSYDNERKAFSFKVPGSRVNYIKIILEATDTYTVQGYKVRGLDARMVREVEGVYAPDLARVFTDLTGLETRL